MGGGGGGDNLSVASMWSICTIYSVQCAQKIPGFGSTSSCAALLACFGSTLLLAIAKECTNCAEPWLGGLQKAQNWCPRVQVEERAGGVRPSTERLLERQEVKPQNPKTLEPYNPITQ